MLLDRKHFELVHALSSSLSQAQAAGRLGISRQVLNNHLRDLEDITGHKILHRPGAYGLTRAGERLAKSALIVLAGMAKIEADLNAMQSDHDVLKVMTNPSVMIDDLPEIRATLKLTYPNLEIHFLDGTISETIEALKNDAIDVGIVYEDQHILGIRCVPYRVDHLHIIMPSNHALAHLNEISFLEASTYKFLGAGANNNIDKIMRLQAEKRKIHLNFSGQAPNYEVQAHLIGTSKDEIALVLGHVAKRFQTFRPIKIIPLSDAWAKATYYLCVRDKGTTTAPTQKFIELTVQQFQRVT